jgi:divalent metal cation (Fe/Co/Zn/Cd) transporter
MTLVHVEHATVGSVHLLGQDIWLGWLMLAAQLYSLVPPLIIGRKELPLAQTLSDKLLHTDALMNKANWMTGAAGIAGVIGLGLGWWWADSVAAAIISIDIISDGVKALRSSTAELIDGAPRALSSPDLSDDAQALKARLEAHYPGATIRLRETGRRIHAEVHGTTAGPQEPIDAPSFWPEEERRLWRLAQIAFVPPRREPDRER